ncbi:MAG: hypothetical protein ABIN01_23130 [Ferruginibacter sp.]
MKKCTLLLAALLFCFVASWSQKINYQKSFEEAKRLSLEQDKPMAILFTMQPPAYANNNLAVLTSPEVVATFNGSFINYKIAREDSASKRIIMQYRVTRFPSLVFLDSKGGLMFKDINVVPIPSHLVANVQQAIDANKEKSLIDFDKEYLSGNYDSNFLKEYINKRKMAGIRDNSELIEKYVDFLTIADLDNYSQVLYILQAGPVADGKAYRLAYTNKKIIDSIYKTEPLEIRTAINNGIIANTMNSAVINKNLTRAYAAANFARTSWGKSYQEGQKNYTLNMLRYYRAIKDTVNYLREASIFYDAYYMSVTADSLKRRDENNKEKAKNSALQRALSGVPEGGALKSFSYAYATENFANELNNAAWSFYDIGTKDGTYLTKAMLWSKRSIELNPISAYYDTLAHLLYRLGLFAEAESTQKKAVDLSKTEKRNMEDMQEALTKIKKRTL